MATFSTCFPRPHTECDMERDCLADTRTPGVMSPAKQISFVGWRHGMASNTLVRNQQVDIFSSWGVTAGPALWPTALRILFVIDGRINTSFDPHSFGLGYVLRRFATTRSRGGFGSRFRLSDATPMRELILRWPWTRTIRTAMNRSSQSSASSSQTQFQLRRLGPGLVLRR